MPNLYKLQNDAKPGQLGGPPLILGSVLRFPSCAYPQWNISGNAQDLREVSLSTYQDEFSDTSPAWMASVVEAANRAGIGDRPNMLRNTVGKAAAHLTYKLLKRQRTVKVTDVGCGAGGSLTAYFTELLKLVPDYAERVEVTLVDLSRNNLWKATDIAKEKGFQTVHPVHSRDIEMGMHIAEPQDIVINVAGIHANSDISVPIRAIAHILSPNGYFVSGDWHHGRWLHPSYTYEMFDKADPKRFDWKNKGAFMDEFASMFPSCKENPDESWMTEEDYKAVEEIETYWMDGWATVRHEKLTGMIIEKQKLVGKYLFEKKLLSMPRREEQEKRALDELCNNYEKVEGLRPTDEQIMSEGHMPVEHYIDACVRNDLMVDTELVFDGTIPDNPFWVVPGTRLNMVFVAKKQ
ncbi:MAG: methyltransferase domain-containing protein [Candidatus Aenigmarchaeota archaeon]|nr:methyltransferase domain-containing protein [Candidatus Aenigmarchaeota archaeon]